MSRYLVEQQTGMATVREAQELLLQAVNTRSDAGGTMAHYAAPESAHKSVRRQKTPGKRLLAYALRLMLGTRAGARGNRRSDTRPATEALSLNATVTVGSPAEDAYRLWRDPQNWPRFMRHLKSVDSWHTGAKLLWGSALATDIECEAEVVDDKPNERIEWRVRGPKGPMLHVALAFRATPTGKGTELHLHVSVESDGAALVTGAAKLLGEIPEGWLRGTLRRSKQILETGEVVRSDASIHVGPHAARPSSGDEVRNGTRS